MHNENSLYEFAPDGRTINRRSGASPFEHLIISPDELTVAYELSTEVTRTIYRYDGALYAYSREPHLSVMGLPAAAAHAFARQPLPTGLPGLIVDGRWMVRVTEPYWRVIVSADRGDHLPVDIEPRFSLVSTVIGADCFHLNQWGAAVEYASIQAEHLGLDMPETFQYENSVRDTSPPDWELVRLGDLYQRCPEAEQDVLVSRTHATGLPVTERQLRQLPALTLGAIAQREMGVRPGGELVWMNRLSSISCSRDRSALIYAGGEFILEVQGKKGTLSHGEKVWDVPAPYTFRVGEPLQVEGIEVARSQTIRSITEISHRHCHHPAQLDGACCSADPDW